MRIVVLGECPGAGERRSKTTAGEDTRYVRFSAPRALGTGRGADAAAIRREVELPRGRRQRHDIYAIIIFLLLFLAKRTVSFYVIETVSLERARAPGKQ